MRFSRSTHLLMFLSLEILMSILTTGLLFWWNFFHLYQREKSSDSKVKFRQASNHCKRVLEAAKLAYANKTKVSITYQKLGSIVTSGELLIVFSTKVNLLYFLYSMGRRCCLLHLIKQNYLLKIFL